MIKPQNLRRGPSINPSDSEGDRPFPDGKSSNIRDPLLPIVSYSQTLRGREDGTI